MNDETRMDIDSLQLRLHQLGVDIPQTTLRRWAYDKHQIIPRPKRDKRGNGSGKRGRAAFWNEKAVTEAAAMWALRNNPRITHAPSLRLISFIKRSASFVYESPTVGYELPRSRLKRDEGVTYESITIRFPYHPWHASGGKQPPPEAEWNELVTTWIAAIEKAKKAKPIKEPYKVCFHWKAVEKGNGVEYTLDDVTLEKSESGLDQIIIMINEVDFRRQLSDLVLF